jgi:hypothetical protein
MNSGMSIPTGQPLQQGFLARQATLRLKDRLFLGKTRATSLNPGSSRTAPGMAVSGEDICHGQTSIASSLPQEPLVPEE